VVRCVIDTAAKRVPVVAGTGSNSTQEALKLTRLAHEAGADAMLVVARLLQPPDPGRTFPPFCPDCGGDGSADCPFIPFPAVCGVEIGVPVVENVCGRNFPMFATSRNPAVRSIASTS